MAKSDKTIIIKRKEKYEAGEFAQFSKKGLALAAQKLGKNGLILWMYLCENKNNYTFTISPTAMQNQLGLTEGTSKTMTKKDGAYDELVKAGFIRDGVFYADGPEEDLIEPKEKKEEEKAITVSDTTPVSAEDFRKAWGL